MLRRERSGVHHGQQSDFRQLRSRFTLGDAGQRGFGIEQVVVNLFQFFFCEQPQARVSPVERNILGEGWSKDLTLPSTNEMEEGKEEGLLAALSKVGIDRFPRIAIVDDEPNVRVLVRRILQSQGNYKLFEAPNGKDAVTMITKELPDLILLDLMMPDMDGFQVMDALQLNKDTKDIPIIVITAKELTPAEKSRLKGHIQSLMQKGDFMSDELLDEVRALLK